MTFGFHAMDFVLPARRPIAQIVKAAGHDDNMLSRLNAGGLQAVPVAETKPVTVLARAVIDRLIAQDAAALLDVRGVIFTHSLPILAPNDHPFLNECLANFGLDSVPRVAVAGQPCSVLHMGIQLCMHWSRSMGRYGKVLLLGADQAYEAADRIFFGSAMGDAAIAGIVGPDAPYNHVISSISTTQVIATEGEDSPADSISKFREVNPFNIRSAIETCLRHANKTLADVDFIVPHTPYMGIWDVMAELLRFPRERILTSYLPDTGHLNSNDVFVHYVRFVVDGIIQSGHMALLVSPGFGGTRGCTLLRR